MGSASADIIVEAISKRYNSNNKLQNQHSCITLTFNSAEIVAWKK